jgi:hypothetical protein
MAIDTAAKRVSSLDHEAVWAAGLPLPDGTIDAADRQHSLWTYSGLAAGEATSGVGPLIGVNRLVGV